MTKRIFTFLIAFLATMSGAVWGQTTSTSGITLSNGQTYNLENTTISVAANNYALTVNDGASATLNITGVCELISGDGSTSAALIPEGSALTITGTGILRIKGNADVQTITGGQKNGKHGTITVSSGTVYMLGDLGHDGSGKHGIIQVQGGIAFVDGTIKGDENADNTAGALFQHNGNTWNGDLFNDYTITSNISGDIDGDGTPNDDNISLDLNEHTLKLGDGVVIDRTTNPNQQFNVSNGIFKYFMANYDAHPAKEGDITGNAPTDLNFYGTNTNITLANGLTCGGSETTGIHEFLGWADETNAIHSAQGTVQTPDSYANENMNGAEDVNFKAAWATQSVTLTTSTGTAMISHTLADTPDGTVTYQSATFPNGITFEPSSGTISGTPTTAGETTVNVTYSYTKDGSEATGTAAVKIIVTQSLPDINDGTPTVLNNGTYIYNNTEYNPIQITMQGDEPLQEGTHFTVTYSYTATDNTTTQDNVTEVKEAGTYTVTKIEATVQATGEAIESFSTPLTVTVQPRTLNLAIRDQGEFELDNLNTKAPNFTPSVYNNVSNPTGTINITISEEEGTGFAQGESGINIFEGTLSPSSEEYKTKVGYYTISASSLELKAEENNNNFSPNNYKIGETITAGNFSVVDALNDDDVETEIKDEDGEDDNAPTEDEDGAWTITYDGKTHEITKVKKGEVEILATGTNGEANYTISYTYKATEEAIEEIEVDLNNGGEVKNAGIYTATITFANGYEGTKTETIIIKPRALTVDLNIPETIDPEQDLDNLSSWWDKDDITLTGIVESEAEDAKANFANASVSIDGELMAGEPADVKVFNVKLEDNESFLTSNYTITYQNGETKPITDFSNLDSDEDNTENDTTIDDGTTVGQIEIDPSDDGDDITGGEDNSEPTDDDLDDGEDFVMIHPDGEGEISVYDGEPHGLSLLIIETQEGKKYTLHEGESADYTVSYTSTESKELEDGKPLHAGSYTATVTLVEGSKYQIKDSEDNSFTLTVQIAQRPLEVYLNVPATIKENQNLEDLSSWWSSSKITFNEGGFANDTEKGNAVETLSDAEASIEGTLPEVGQKADVKLMNVGFDDADPFFKSNYTITYYKGSTKVEGENVDLSDEDSDSNNDDTSIDDGTTVDDSDKIEIDPDDDGTDITGGEDEDGDDDLDDNDYIMVSTGAGNEVNAIYDGETHTIENMVVTVDGTTYYLTAGTDFTVGFNNGEEGLEEGKPHDAGTYTASIEMTGKYKGEFDLTVTINHRPLEVNVNLPKFIEPDQDLSNLSSWWNPSSIQLNGIVKDEESAARETLADAEAIIESMPQSGAVNVTVKNIKLEDKDPFFTKNYTITYKNGQSTTLSDSDFTDKDDDGKNNDTDIDGGTTVIDPDYDGDYTDFLDYYNIYEDQICEGVTVEFSRDVVREGQSVLVTIKADEGVDTSNMTLEFKRALFGYWEDLTLTPTENPGEYIIKNIYTDIYVRVEGAVPTGIESIDGAKVYAKDGSLFVQTPQQEQVRIISMTGAIVKNETQIGLRQYTGLNRGIYVVCVGDERFKVRL